MNLALPFRSELLLVFTRRRFERVDDVKRECEARPESSTREFARAAVNPDCRAGGVKRFDLLREKNSEDAAQHVAAAGFGKRGVAGAVDIDALAVGDDGAMAF